MQVQLNVVYETKLGGQEFEGEPTFTVKGGTVNLYVSNSDTKPTSSSGMILDSSSPLAEDAHRLPGSVKWVLFESASGSPIVQERFLVVP